MTTASERSRPARRTNSGNRDPRARMLDGLALEQRRLDVAGVVTSVLEAGAGSPLVLLHGGIECGGAYWAPVIARLSRRHRLIIPDAPGLGESEPISRLDPSAFAGWLTSVIHQTCSEKPALAAHSLLGTLAAHYAVGHSEQLRKLVLYGAPGIGPYRMPIGLMLTAIRFDLRPTARNSERFERWAFFDLERAYARDVEWFEAFRAYSVARAIVPHVKRTMRCLIKIGTKRIPDAELQRIQVPATLLWGRHDRMTPLGLAERASRQCGWPLRVIEDAGHVPHIEQPEAFIDALHNDN